MNKQRELKLRLKVRSLMKENKELKNKLNLYIESVSQNYNYQDGHEMGQG